MASGLAAIGFDYAAVGQHVTHGESGIKVEMGSPESFVAASSSLAQAPALWRRLGRSARGVAMHRGWRNTVRQLEVELSRVTAWVRPSK